MDEDVQITMNDVLFIADKSFLEKNGTSFKIYLNEKQAVVLESLSK